MATLFPPESRPIGDSLSVTLGKPPSEALRRAERRIG